MGIFMQNPEVENAFPIYKWRHHTLAW